MNFVTSTLIHLIVSTINITTSAENSNVLGIKISNVVAEKEFSKDITSLIIESTLRSRCDGNVFITTNYCQRYLNHALMSMSDWAPPLIIVKFIAVNKISKLDKESWNKFLSWKRRSCSLIFVCDLQPPPIVTVNYVNESEFEFGDAIDLKLVEDTDLHLGYIEEFPTFVTHLDQILHFSAMYNTEKSETALDSFNRSLCSGSASGTDILEQNLLKKTGVLLSIKTERFTETYESDMQICAKCDVCGYPLRMKQEYLGQWKRNKTNFAKFFDAFDTLKNNGHFNHSVINIGYFDYPPHFSCQNNINNENDCIGIEWEIISELSKSLKFTFNLINVGIGRDRKQNLTVDDESHHITNFTGMILALQMGKVDMVVGGISATNEKVAAVDFTQVFSIEPIVFVVKKQRNVFLLGIWLAFQPQVWPLVILLLVVMSILFQLISTDSNCCGLLHPRRVGNKSMSHLMEEAILKARKKKPALVGIFEALELTLQPMLGQPLNNFQIISQPRRMKILLILWWFSCLIITTLYSTSLISSLLNPTISKEPESLQNLIDSGYRFKIAGRHAAVRELFLIPKPPSLTSNTAEVSVSSHEDEKIAKILLQVEQRLISLSDSEEKYRIAYIIEESGVKAIENSNATTTTIKSNMGLQDMKVIHERLLLTGYSFALKPQAPYKRKIDTALARLNAGGLIEYWNSKFIAKTSVLERKFRLRERLGQINLDLRILQGAFIFLIFGLSFAGFVFGLEHWNKRYRFKFYSKKEFISFIRHLTRFYQRNFAENSQERNQRKQQEKFRMVVKTLVKMKNEEKQKQQTQTFLK